MHESPFLKAPVRFAMPWETGNERKYIEDAIQLGRLSGDNKYTQKCHEWLRDFHQISKVLLTHSGTAALEMSAHLANIEEGDEVILPSFTFASSANAYVLRGARIVFVDIRPDTLNLDETKIEEALTPRTKAIVPIHYAGVACEMDSIMTLSQKHNCLVLEDNAHGIFSKYRGKLLGTFGDFNSLSFHETKNIVAGGEGGALLIRDGKFFERAEIIREKGTNRTQFFRGEVDKYTWVDVGSSYLPSELNAAFLTAQLESYKMIQEGRMKVWNTYHEIFAELELKEKVRRPIVPAHCEHNAHIYYLLLPTSDQRNFFLQKMKSMGVTATSHYIPLHSSPAGLKFGRIGCRSMSVTESVSSRLVRLPIWPHLERADEIADLAIQVIKGI